MRLICTSILCFVSLFVFKSAFGADFPSHPVKIVVPFAAGGSLDLVTRLIGERFQSLTGQPIVVDNRGGANGLIAADMVAKSSPDGYTLLAATVGQMSLNPSTYKSLPYDPETNFVPITLMVHADYVLVAGPSLKVRDLGDLTGFANKNPDALKIASTGLGTPSHFLVSALSRSAGARVVNVPYKGVGPALNDILGGHIQAGFQPTITVKNLIAAGKLTAIAVSSSNRIPSLPNVPTFKELGHAEVRAPLWTGLVAPAGTPKEVVDKLGSLMMKILRMPDVIAQLRKADQEPVGNSPAEFAEFLRADRARWSKIIRESGFEPSL